MEASTLGVGECIGVNRFGPRVAGGWEVSLAKSQVNGQTVQRQGGRRRGGKTRGFARNSAGCGSRRLEKKGGCWDLRPSWLVPKCNNAQQINNSSRRCANHAEAKPPLAELLLYVARSAALPVGLLWFGLRASGTLGPRTCQPAPPLLPALRCSAGLCRSSTRRTNPRFLRL